MTCRQRRWEAGALDGRAEACSQVNVSVEREILNHRSLIHPHIIRFREVRLVDGASSLEFEEEGHFFFRCGAPDDRTLKGI